MDRRFDEIAQRPENEVFRVVFFPDRIYHAQYLNATRSARYRYNVTEVRASVDVVVLKGEVFLDGAPLTSFLRIEYRASRLVELSRTQGRLLGSRLKSWVCVHPNDPSRRREATVTLEHCPWTDAYQVELWRGLDPPDGRPHDFAVLDQMGRNGAITRARAFDATLDDLKGLKEVELAFREEDAVEPDGKHIDLPSWDNNYLRSVQRPVVPAPSSPKNTIETKNYYVNFRRGWHIDVRKMEAVRYLNAMMDPANRDAKNGNVIEMRWVLQRELGGSLVFFHEVTIPPGRVEGTHQHIGTEELYYIVSGTGTAFMGLEDDPDSDSMPAQKQQVYGLDERECRVVPVEEGHVIFTKSGGIHGIRNDSNSVPLRFIAFLYHTI